MKQQNVGQDCNTLLHVLGSEIQKAKISAIKELGGFSQGNTTLPLTVRIAETRNASILLTNRLTLHDSGTHPFVPAYCIPLYNYRL